MNHSNDINDTKSSHGGWPPGCSESSVNVPSHSYSEVIFIIISALIGLILTEFFHADMADNLITASHISLHFPGAPASSLLRQLLCLRISPRTQGQTCPVLK